MKYPRGFAFIMIVFWESCVCSLIKVIYYISYNFFENVDLTKTSAALLRGLCGTYWEGGVYSSIRSNGWCFIDIDWWSQKVPKVSIALASNLVPYPSFQDEFLDEGAATCTSCKTPHGYMLFLLTLSPQPPSFFPSSLSPTLFDPCYAGYCSVAITLRN